MPAAMLDTITDRTQYYRGIRLELTKITVGGRDEKSIDQYSACGIFAHRRHNTSRRLGSRRDRDLRDPAGPAGRASAERRADGRPGRHSLYAVLGDQQQRPGPWPAAFILVQTERPIALRCCAGQSREPPAQHPSARIGVPEIFSDIADLRPLQRHCLAGQSENGQSNRVHEHRTGFELRPQRADLRQGGQRLRVRLVFGRHLEDRPQRWASIDFRRFSNAVAAGRHGCDPGAAPSAPTASSSTTNIPRCTSRTPRITRSSRSR